MLRFDQAEYWFLDAAIYKEIPVSVFRPDYEHLEELLNRRHHELAYYQVLETLYRLYQRGEILFNSLQNEAMQCDWKAYVYHAIPVTLQDLEAALFGEIHLDYMLTVQGGARWEALVQPNWDRYFESSEVQSDLTGWVCGGNKEIIKQYLVLAYYAQPVIEASKVWTELTPWQATYWKTQPHGYRVDFCITEVGYWEEQKDTPLWVNRQLVNLRDWYTSYLEQA